MVDDTSSTGPTTAATTGSTATSSTSTTAATTTTTTTQPTTTTTTFDPVTVLATGDFEPAADVSTSVGSPDTVAAATIAAGLQASGLDLTGIEIWVLSATGSGEKMLVLTTDAAADQLAEDEEGTFFTTLVTLPAITDFGIERFTLHYYDSDEQGPFVFTTTLPFSLFADMILNNVDPDETMVGIQLQRLGS